MLGQITALCLQPDSAASVAPEHWPALLRVALEHGVAPLMYLRVRDQAIPQSVRTELAHLYRANLARNFALSRQL